MARRGMARRDYDSYSFRSRRGGKGKVIISILIVLLALLAYWYLNPSSAPGWMRDLLPGAATTVYKWRDDQGNWQYTNAPPSDRQYEPMDYWENANIIPAQPASQ